MNNANELLQQAVDDLLSEHTSLEVLEAGCGALSRVSFHIPTTITGIDISEVQLERNSQLTTKILGDIESYPLPKQAYDVIISWDVLEHLNNPQAAVKNLSQALKPKGILILAMPNLWSCKGMVTKLTPYWFHVFFYKYIVGDKSVDTAQTNQFPTFFRRFITPGSLSSYLRGCNCTIPFMHIYEGPVPEDLRRKYWWFNFASKGTSFISKLCTLGRCDLSHSDYMIIAQKQS